MTGAQDHCCLPGPVRHTAEPIQPHVEPADSAQTQRCIALGDNGFEMGAYDSAYPEDGEAPVREVRVDAFEIATTAVSNREFQCFVQATGHVTFAERHGSSFVFDPAFEKPSANGVFAAAPWWRDVAGACWRAPHGVDSSLLDLWDHPVVHVTRDDALAYCHWSRTRLPTEAEWEYAARGGLSRQPYPWGDELLPDGLHRCNIWQGEFPFNNSGDDGFAGTAPVAQYLPNAYGLYNMTGNVWEWVADRFTRLHSPRPVRNPQGPLNGDRFVARGGSWLCHHSYCLRYRTSSRQALHAATSAGNLGFRVAVE